MPKPKYPAPVYDIDQILLSATVESPLNVAMEFEAIIASAFSSESELVYPNPKPESGLLEPEIVVSNLCMLENSMGNGFDVLLGYGGGRGTFLGGLRGAAIVSANAHLQIIEEAWRIVDIRCKKMGIDPALFWADPTGIDWDIEEALQPDLAEVNSRYWALKFDDLFIPLLRYLEEHREELLCRKPPGA